MLNPYMRVLFNSSINQSLHIFQAEDLIRIHESKCKNHDPNRPTQLSTDGLSESKSSTVSMDIFCARFDNCHTIYPHTITRPVNKHKLDGKPYLIHFIKDFINNECNIKQFIGDNPKRAFIKFCLSHSASFACEYCFNKGTSQKLCSEKLARQKENLESQIKSLNEKIAKLLEGETEEGEDVSQPKQEEISTMTSIKDYLCVSLKELSKHQSKVVWPYSSSKNAEPRTTEKVIDIVNRIENGENLSSDQSKGVVGRSPLLALENFNFVLDVPTEYLHCMCLGCIKRLVELTFNVGPSRPRITKRKLTPVSVFNALIANIKGPCEFSRRVRALDFSVWKGQEFRNLALFFFPIVLDCLPENAKERRLWLLLAFMMRACVIPTPEFQLTEIKDIEYCSDQYYKLYEKLFGVLNCTYNTHIVFSHILEIRTHGPLTLTSAFGFEQFYGEIRNSYTPGTVATLKQILQKVYLRRSLSRHTCKPKITFKLNDTSLECNNLIYTFRFGEYQLYKIVHISETDFNCVKIKTENATFRGATTLPWKKVGVFKLNEFSQESVKIKPENVAGKVVKVNDVLLTCPLNVLDEK